MPGQTQTHKVQTDSRLGRVFPHSCHSALICILIPVYTALSSLPSLSPAACYPPSLSPFSVPVSRSATCHSVRPRGQASVSIYASDTKPVRQREKGLGLSKTGNTRGPLRLTSTNWLATPARLILLRFSHRCPPATATQCRGENRGTGENCGQLSKLKKKKTHTQSLFDAFWVRGV